jgi:hypothetical protein
MTGRIVRDSAVQASAASGAVVAAGAWYVGRRRPVAVVI